MFEHEIALSFAGEQRPQVEEIANCLIAAGVNVFYDKLAKAELWGKDLYQHLSDVYLPRLESPAVLVDSIRSGLALLTWEKDAFAYAESYDESVPRYRGLHYGMQFTVSSDDAGLLVRPEIARKQIDDEPTPRAPSPEPTAGGSVQMPATPTGQTPVEPTAPVQSPKPKRFHGTVVLDSARVGRDASRIADEVITHLVGLVGSNVKITLDIDAEIPAGVPDNVVRTVTENSRALKFGSSGFEKE
jgi:hypothetical protein